MEQRIWKRRHQLDRMTLRSLSVAFAQYPAVHAYVALASIAGFEAFRLELKLIGGLAAVGLSALFYPFVWYVLHRWVLHSRWMFKHRWSAQLWKRIHYDHHMDPNRLEVLFGALHTTLPTIALATAPLGWLCGGAAGAMAAFCTGLLMTCAYEFVHCVEHLPYKPRNRLLARMKALHLAHHFHDERGNFGITNFAWDRLLGTIYERRDRPVKSPTVFNLGYDEEAAQKYPWVAAQDNPPSSNSPDRASSRV